jgi:anti-sigma factor RsiW
MTEYMCEKISQEKLVLFADGELPPSEAAQVSEHVSQCESCAAMVEALQQSMELATASWAAEQAKWPKWRLPEKHVQSKWPAVRVGAVAAGILLVLGLGMIWRMLSEPGKLEPSENAIARAEQKVMRAGTAAQMLAVGDLLAEQSGGLAYARQRYKEIVMSYSDTEYAKQAELRLKTF